MGAYDNTVKHYDSHGMFGQYVANNKYAANARLQFFSPLPFVVAMPICISLGNSNSLKQVDTILYFHDE